MTRTNGFFLALVILFLIPGCKKDTPPPQEEEAPVKIEKNLAEPQQDVDPSAKEAAARFLKALKIIDSPEGRKTLAEIRWRQTMKFPEYQEIEILSEKMFATDVPGVKGYKEVAKLAIPQEGRRPLVKHYMLIAYEDTKKKAWKVFDFTDAKNAANEAERACEEKALAGSAASTPQGCHVRCSYWLLMAGKIEEAERVVKKANQLYAQNPDPDDEARYYKARADATLEMISRMTGAQL